MASTGRTFPPFSPVILHSLFVHKYGPRRRYISRNAHHRQQSMICQLSKLLNANDCPKGSQFQLNVIDSLTDNTMLRSTSIVRLLQTIFPLARCPLWQLSSSIGMASSKMDLIGPTAHPSWHSARLPPTTHFCMISPYPIRPEHSGTIPTCQPNTVMAFGVPWWFTTLATLTQHCTTLMMVCSLQLQGLFTMKMTFYQ